MVSKWLKVLCIAVILGVESWSIHPSTVYGNIFIDTLKKGTVSYPKSYENEPNIGEQIDSINLGDFVIRTSTVPQVVQADHEISKQLTVKKQQYENLPISSERKRNEQVQTITGYESRTAPPAEQHRHINELKNEKPKMIQKSIRNPVVIEQKRNRRANFTNNRAFTNSNSGYLTKIISSSSQYIGNSVYVFGGGRTAYDIANGRFDCSGFVHWAFTQAGINIGMDTESQKNSGRQIPKEDLQPGDLVFFDTYKRDGHVGIYIGKGKFIGSQSSTGVAIADMTKGYWKETFHGHVVRI